VLLAAFLLLQPVAFAQSQFATLSGTVTDSTGGVIVGASITVKPAHSADTRKTVTNQDGFFSVPTLPAGTYEVTVDMKGFKKWHGTDIALNGADSRAMNIQLQVGAANETVIVEGQITELATKDSGEKSALISSNDLNNLSLVGRNAVEYLRILPGAILSANGGLNKLSDSGETMAINAAVGAGGGALSNLTLNGQNVDVSQDGQRVVDPGSNSLVPVNPNPDMISEVKVLTSNFTAENAKGPVVMNSTTKGGGSDFHGAAYMYARNTALNSTEHYNVYTKAPSPKPPSSYYYPGGNIGGPVLIPGTGFNKSRKKLFFFEGFEYYKQQLDGGLERAFVPTADMLNGDFSALTTGYGSQVGRQILAGIPTAPKAGAWLGFDQRAAAGCTISAAVLSSGCISSAAQIYLKHVVPVANVDPNTHQGYNFYETYSVPQNSWQNVTRGDWAISDYTKVYVSWSRQRETNNWPVGLWVSTCDWCVPSPSPIVGKNGSDFVSGTFVHVFSPTMTMEGRIGYMKESLVNAPTDPSKFYRDKVGYPLKGIYSDQDIPAVVSWGDSTPNYGEVGYDYHPKMVAYKGIPSGAANLTKVLGTHSTKYGFYYEHAYNKQDNWQQYMGVISYTTASWAGPATATGNQYADMLMGIGQSGFYQQGPPVTIELAQNISSWYAQDDWKVTRRLSIQYGLRFEHYAKPYSPGFGLAVFDPTKYNASAVAGVNTGVSWHAIDSADPLSGSKSRFLFLSPRLGAAYDLFGNGKTVVRGGWGKYRAYDSVQNRSYTDPAGTALGIVSWGNCGKNDSRCPTWESIDQYAYTPVLGHPSLQGTAFTAVSPNNDEQPLVEAYSLTIDQELPGKFKAELSYVGNHSPIQLGAVNINSVPVGTLNAAGFTCPPGTGNPSDSSCQQAVRPFSLYQGLTEVLVVGKSRFDSFQGSLIRYYGWLTLQANYTFSKNMGEGPGGLDGSNGPFTGALPDYGAKWLYGIDNLNRAHMLSAAYVFSLPKTKSSSAFVREALDDWQISGITQVASGPQLNVQSSNFNMSATYNNVGMIGTPDISLYPLITCNPKSGLAKGQYLNPSCFNVPGANHLGTAGMPYIPGPMYWNTDLTLLKTFKLTERKNLQFRFAAFNPFNTALKSFSSGDNNLKLQYNDLNQLITGTSCPATTIDPKTAPNGVPCTQQSTFGRATAIFGQRKLELGLKFTF